MAKQVTLGTLKLWEQTLDEAVAGVMSRVRIVESRNEIYAKKQIYDEQGITMLLKRLEDAKKVVETVETGLKQLGVCPPTCGRYGLNEKNQQKLENAISQRAQEMHVAEVAAFIATVKNAKEQVRLAMFPSDVQKLLTDVRAFSERLMPKLLKAEQQTAKLLKAARINGDDEE